MTQFVQYIYYKDQKNPTEAFHPADGLTYETVDLVETSIGFRFIDANTLEDAMAISRRVRTNKNNKIVSYYLSNQGDMISTDSIRQSDSVYGPFHANFIEKEGFHRVFGQFLGVSMTMDDKDLVIDPASREIIHPAYKS